MNEPIKLTDGELAEFRMLRDRFQEMVWKFGELGMEKIDLDRLVTEFVGKEGKLKEDLSNLQTLENGLLDKIIKKYGEGNLSIETGVFTPSQPPPK